VVDIRFQAAVLAASPRVNIGWRAADISGRPANAEKMIASATTLLVAESLAIMRRGSPVT
jgi:hypothetical protein